MIGAGIALRFGSTLKRVAASGAVLLLAVAFRASAQNQDVQSQGTGAGAPHGMEAQPGGGVPSSNPGIVNQPGDDTTLEITPQTQPGFRPPAGSNDDTSTNREFRPGDNTSAINPEFNPGSEAQDLNPNGGGGGSEGQLGNSRSCLGVQLNYTNYCFKGAEEHGLEVVSIDRNSPAEQAGLKATSNQGVLAAVETASALLGPMQMLTDHFTEQARQAARGDLIVAVDDQRIRSQADFNDALARARPGDTLYLTVIRPLPKGDHATMKIAIKVGKWQPGDAASCTAMTTASSQGSLPQ
jgi:hypothetical protein